MARMGQINRVIELGVSHQQTNYRDMMQAMAALAQESARNRLLMGGVTVGAASQTVGDANGAITLGTPAYGPGVKTGVYTIVGVTEAANAGTFSVTDPDGIVVGIGTVAVAFNGPIRFTLADGAEDLDIGDTWTITVSAAPFVALTDSSTGSAGSSLVAVNTPTTAAVDLVTSMAPKAGFDTAIGKIEDAHGEIKDAINEMIALIAGGGYPNVDDFSEAAASDGTIAALDKTLSGTTSDDAGVPAADGIAQIVIARNNQALLCSALNFVRVAVGLAPLTDNSGGTFTKGSDGSWDGTDAAATGTAASTGENSLTDATVDLALTALANNVATLAAYVNNIRTNLSIGPFVIATMSPNTRFRSADVTG